MPQYAVLQSHPPDNCPLTNRAVREFAKKVYADAPNLAQQLGVNVLVDIHLDPGHRAFTLFEAPSAEAVRDYLVRGGFAHFLDLQFHLVTPLQELVQHMDDLPTLY